MSQNTKNQHYVPRLLLKGFDRLEVEKPKVNILDLRCNKFRENQNIEKIFSENYFYDRENEMEDFLMKRRETPASIPINRIRNNEFKEIIDNKISLINFLACQNVRTATARNETLEKVNSKLQSLVAELLVSSEVDHSHLLEIAPSNKETKSSLITVRTLLGIIDSVGLQDLKLHLLINKTDLEFVISDHPLIQYNWLYKDSKDPCVSNIFANGLQFFLPISERIYLCAYDKGVYGYGDKKTFISHLTNGSDINWLNELQVRNSSSMIAFKSKYMMPYLTDLRKRFFEKQVYLWSSIEQVDESQNHVIIEYKKQINLKSKPSFFKVLKKAKHLKPSVQERNPEVSASLRAIKESIHLE